MEYHLNKISGNPNSTICHQIKQYYDYCQFIRGFSKNTMNDKVCAINQFVTDTRIKDLRDISNELIYDWMAELTRKGNKPNTVNDRIKNLKAMLRYYVDEGFEFPNYDKSKIKKQAVGDPNRRVFDRRTISRVLNMADRETWLMIKLMFDCGLRISELRNLTLDNIDNLTLHIMGKGNKCRFAILSEDARVRLTEFVEREHLSNYLFPSKTKRNCPQSCVTIRRKIREAFEAAGVHQALPHELRNSYAADLEGLGLSTYTISKGLGHSSVKITEEYLKYCKASRLLKHLYEVKYSADEPELH